MKSIIVSILFAILILPFQVTSAQQEHSVQMYNNPTWSPDGNYIAYTVDAVGQDSLWVMENDGQNSLNLTPNFEAIFNDFSWSPDGERLTFAARRAFEDVFDIWMINRDGTNLTNLTRDLENRGTFSNRNPAWSPNGRYIGFEADYHDRNDIVILDLETNHAKNITQGISTVNKEIAWSPDSQFVAIRSTTLITPETYEFSFSEIFVISRDGSSVTNITESHRSEIESILRPGDELNTIRGVAWSPTENLIAFSVYYDGDGEIFIVDSAGDTLQLLTEASFFLETFPKWSPDGETIAYTMVYHGESDIWTQTINELVPDNLTLLFEGDRYHRMPDWSPDGSKIVFVSGRPSGSSFSIWVMNADGTNPTKLNG